MADDTWLRNRMRWQYRSRSVECPATLAASVARNSDCEELRHSNGREAMHTASVDTRERDRALPTARVAAGVQQVFRQREAAALFGVSVSTWKRYVAAGLVPQPIRLGPRRVGWLERDLIAVQDALRDGPH